MAEHIDWYLQRLDRQQEEARDWIERIDKVLAKNKGMGAESAEKFGDSRTSRDGVKVDGTSTSNGHERV